MTKRHGLIVALVLIALAFPTRSVSERFIDMPGYNVLILTDVSIGSDSDPIWLSPKVNSWLTDNASSIYAWDDSETDLTFVSKPWAEAFDRAKDESEGKRPWILISGKKQASQQLPNDPSSLLDLLERCK